MDGGVTLTRGASDAWTDWADGLNGLRYRNAVTMPAFSQAVSVKDHGNTASVKLHVGSVPVRLVQFSPVFIGLDGTPSGPADEYGRLGSRLWDRLKEGDMPLLDKDLIHFCRLALMSCTNLTEELCHVYGLITTATVEDILDTASGFPKAVAGAGG